MKPLRRLPLDIDEVVARGGTILTGNQRAARALRLDFDRQRLADGCKSWQAPKIFAWDTWLSHLWHDAILGGYADRLLLNRTQELQLWRSVISADSDSQWSSLQSLDSLAAMAADAWQQLCAWSGESRLRSLGVSGDTRAFQRWAQSFTRRCRNDLYLSQSELEAAVSDLVSDRWPAAASKEMLLIGFDSASPAQTQLLKRLRESSISISSKEAVPVAQEISLASAEDPDDELIQAALWLRRAVEAYPEARIAVIHPDIASERGELERVFRRILSPELDDITASLTDCPFEFSLGHPLSQQPMVGIALQLLRWAVAPLSIGEISHLLLSPYFASTAPERHQRAEFDLFELRRIRLLHAELDLSRFIEHIQRSRRASSLTGLLRQLRELQRAASTVLDGNNKKSFAEWSEATRKFLQVSSWTSAIPETSIEFQTRRKWESTLDELATLDFEGTRVTFPQALDRLEETAGRTLFAPESREAPIQIMSPREAAGSRFDALYFLRASDLSWPVRPGMNPLLGWRLQRDLQMPGSDAAQDAEAARRITARLAASAQNVVFSYAKANGDSRQRPSPAIAALSLTPLAAVQPGEPHSIIGLETVEDAAFIPLMDTKVRGGSDILKLQAACGFRAFAEKRLWSTAPEPREPGMNAAERGNIVHTALEGLWLELRTQASLRALSSEQRIAALSRAVDRSLSKFQTAAIISWDIAYLEVQRERLHRLLWAWLDLELTRPPFEVRLQEQNEEDAAIGPLLLGLRVDRADRVFNEDGEELGEVILDYKTGVAGPLDWQGERPNEPQLPLYAALREPGSVAGVAFASLRPGNEMGLRGFAAGEGILPKPAKLAFETLEEQIADWHRILTTLASDFAEGDARVRPKAYPVTCEFCQQRILCRLDPSTLEDRNEDAEETDA